MNDGEGAPDNRREHIEGISPGTIVALVIAVAFFVYLVRAVLLPFALAGIVAYLCAPLINWLVGLTRLPRWLFALALLIVLIGFAILFGLFAGPGIAQEILDIAGNVQGTVQTLARQLMGDQTFNLLGEPVNAAEVGQFVVAGLRNWFGESGRIVTVAAIGVGAFFGYILTWVLLGYFLLDAPRIARGLAWVVPPRYRRFTGHIWQELDPLLRRYFIGVAVVVIYASLIAYVGLGFILKVRHAGLLALLTGVLEVVPLIGPAASAVIAGLVAVQEATSGWNVVAYIIYAIVLRVSIDQFVGPIVLGSAAQIRPVLVIFCFLSGAILYGVIGMVMAVPVALTVKVILKALYDVPAAGEAKRLFHGRP